MTAWHAQSALDAARRLESDPRNGLDAAEAGRRAAVQGPNLLREAPRRRWYALLAGQFRDFMILVLLAAAALAAVTGGTQDVVVILAIVLLNAGIGFGQEYRAEQAIHALRRMAAPEARVRRGGEVSTLPASVLVTGDVVLIEAGSVVPADLRLIEAADLALDESALTGESQAVPKLVDALPDEALGVADRPNMAFKGTTVARGRGIGLCVATGMDTELGRIAGLLAASVSELTPLQKRLAAFGRRLSLIVIGICLLILAAGLLRGEPLVLMLLTSISLAVAAIPEALPAVVTISLALGARKMVRRHALVRHLPAVETLGSVTYACTDKTGTLTQNRMRVRAWFVCGAESAAPPERLEGDWLRLREALAVSNDVESGAAGLVGDPTEVALVEAAWDMGLAKAEGVARLPRCGELPFDAARQRMTTVHRVDAGSVAFVKGAPEAVLPLCALDAEAAAQATAAARRMAGSGRRVLAIALRAFEDRAAEPAEAESGLRFLGLAGIEDPPRPEAAAAVRACREAGIVPIMITGDHPDTARSIAHEVGLLPEDGRVLTGAELESLDVPALAAVLGEPVAFARVSPQHKIRIIEALKARGEFVAMTGDGVNDAPALRRADIGVAMGRGGTDVAREAADMVLLDDNFATLVAAVEEGRRIYDNVRKFVKYTMTSNTAEVLTLLLAPFLGMPLALLPIHILWINLVTDGLPGLALTVEPAERDVMRRPPRPPVESLFGRGLWQHMAGVGGLMAVLALLSMAWALGEGSEGWQTLVFTVLVFAQLMHVVAIRSERDSLLSRGLLTNLPLAVVVAVSVLVQLAIVYTPQGNAWFHTVPLTAAELGVACAAAAAILAAVEVEKVLVRRGWLYRDAVRVTAGQPGT
ncbi:MAG: cation-translocating P-type ATPase [Steroidobacteraceae bacterium]|jgi:Ca2+-transporting ATPase|nr:cation-translocating P-type ATPase [Steroidobacteraceae bacterium]